MKIVNRMALVVCLSTAANVADANSLFGSITSAIEKGADKVKESTLLNKEEEQKEEPLEKATSNQAKEMASSAEQKNSGLCPEDLEPITLTTAQKFQKQVAKTVVNQALKSLDIEGVELPEEITSICQAEKRFVYLDRSTDSWARFTISSYERAAEALAIDHQIEAARVFKEGKQFSDLSGKEIKKLGKDLEQGMSKVEQAMEKNEADNAELLAEASANIRAALLHGLQIVGWDQRLGEFAGDNILWTTKNLSRIKMFKNHTQLMGGTVKSMAKVTAAYQANARDGVADRKYEQTLARLEKSHQEDDAKLTQELEL